MIPLPIIKAEDQRRKAGGDPTDRHMCFDCQSCYIQMIKERKVDEFKPNCSLSSDIQIADLMADPRISSLEKAYIQHTFDPVVWAANEFNFSTEGREYQEKILRCSAQKRILRMGRRLGKTTSLAVDALYHIARNEDFKILIVTPYQDQVELIFNMINQFIEESVTLKHMVTATRKSPSYVIEFGGPNRAIRGVTAGTKAGAKAGKIRGQDAHMIYLDEADMLSRGDLESILAILTSHPECKLWASGTPTGKREYFYKWSTDPKEGFKTFHFPSSVGPSWDEEMEAWLRNTYTESGFIAEFEAGFPELADGVFPTRMVDACQSHFDPYQILPTTKDFIFGVGVDWNEAHNGVHICLVGLNKETNQHIFLRKWVISNQSYTQVAAIEKLYEINQDWNPSFIYVDQGYGATQVQLLQKMGRQDPSTGLHRKVKAITMGGKTEVYDPLFGRQKKYTKPLMVNTTVRRLEQDLIVVPATEYTRDTKNKQGLIDQMLSFTIERVSPDGRPVYSQGNEHLLTAWMLAIFGFWSEHTDLFKGKPASTISVIQRDDNDEEELPKGFVRLKTTPAAPSKKKNANYETLLPISRGLGSTNSSASSVLQHQRSRRGRKPLGVRSSFNPLSPYKRKSF